MSPTVFRHRGYRLAENSGLSHQQVADVRRIIQ